MGHVASTAGREPRDRFFVKPEAIGPNFIRLDPAQQHQIRRVLRLRDGDTILVLDGTGDTWVAALHTWGAELGAVPLERRRDPSTLRRRLWLYASALRGDRFAWLLQKGTEIGVAGFVPTRFARTLQADYAARMDRYQTIVREAAEQARSAWLPEVAPPRSFGSLLPDTTSEGSLWLLLDEQEESQSLRQQVSEPCAAVHLFIGPEGGLTDEERALARAHGLATVSLGRRILRAETAALIAATITLAASGDLG
jgi:16S rRNA (uracil1498-N3)-methyltransferase